MIDWKSLFQPIIDNVVYLLIIIFIVVGVLVILRFLKIPRPILSVLGTIMMLFAIYYWLSKIVLVA